jgi:glycerol-3-phosphate acyltransferase PlsY
MSGALSPAAVLALRVVLAVLCGYFLGSVPFSYIAVRLGRGKDLRREGTGHLGALNAKRAAGWGIGILVFCADAGKGALAAYLGTVLAPDAAAAAAAAGPSLGGMAGFLGAVLGHNYSCFVRGAGGKGLAATGGALLYLSWRVFVGTGLAGLLVLAACGNMYLAAVAMACALPAVMAWLGPAGPVGAGWWLSFLVAAAIVSRHAGDLRVIARGGGTWWWRRKPPVQGGVVARR